MRRNKEIWENRSAERACQDEDKAKKLVARPKKIEFAAQWKNGTDKRIFGWWPLLVNGHGKQAADEWVLNGIRWHDHRHDGGPFDDVSSQWMASSSMSQKRIIVAFNVGSSFICLRLCPTCTPVHLSILILIARFGCPFVLVRLSVCLSANKQSIAHREARTADWRQFAWRLLPPSLAVFPGRTSYRFDRAAGSLLRYTAVGLVRARIVTEPVMWLASLWSSWRGEVSPCKALISDVSLTGSSMGRVNRILCPAANKSTARSVA